MESLTCCIMSLFSCLFVFSLSTFVFYIKRLICVLCFEKIFDISSFSSGDENLLGSGSNYSEAVDLGYVSPKLYELVLIFQSLR